jgi:diacylglycerol kinase family enzyme
VPVQRVIADGEDAGRTPVEVSVAAGAIRVLVPKAGPTLDSTRTD